MHGSNLYEVNNSVTECIYTPQKTKPLLEIRGLSYSYGSTRVIKDLCLQAYRGEFLTILGPSGSGKSTLLKIIAGLEIPEQVEKFELSGASIVNVPANKRNVSTVFQHYALFPHMTVGENVEYGLRLRGLQPALRTLRAKAALELVRLSDKYNRPIHQISGGEKQRVAIARSLVIEPEILLLDEPLGSLDERLREQMQRELVEIRKKTNNTFLLVTHSQEEAITMSDRIVLMRSGQIEQVGAPKDLFEAPATMFAAIFMGVENVLEATLVSREGRYATVSVGKTRLVGCAHLHLDSSPINSQVFISFRAEDLCFSGEANSDNKIFGTPMSSTYRGRYTDVILETDLGRLVLRRLNSGDANYSNIFSVSREKCNVGPLL
jgi:ABC-type Fe3+/spermidine/putrescine transport system ATPase subunit